jgi:hypothetical protein
MGKVVDISTIEKRLDVWTDLVCKRLEECQKEFTKEILDDFEDEFEGFEEQINEIDNLIGYYSGPPNLTVIKGGLE